MICSMACSSAVASPIHQAAVCSHCFSTSGIIMVPTMPTTWGDQTSANTVIIINTSRTEKPNQNICWDR